MGDPLGSPRVAPLQFAFAASGRFAGVLVATAVDDSPPRERTSGREGFVAERGRRGRGRGRGKRKTEALVDGCDHTSTNAPDPIRTPKLSVLGRE